MPRFVQIAKIPAEELARLQEENARLRSRIAELEANRWAGFADGELETVCNALYARGWETGDFGREVRAELERRREA